MRVDAVAVQIGSFVRCRTYASYGIGKIVDADTAVVRIEYFESPASGGTRQVAASTDDIRVYPLPVQTRVYHHKDDTGWRVGRVKGPIGNGYLVEFPNGTGCPIPERELYVRTDREIRDPTDFLALRAIETPFFHDLRSPFVRHVVAYRNACLGLTGLASSAIALEPWQIEEVRRVLQDPVQRYLLADEVGLGKTIEACALIRQYLLDDPDASVLIVVPRLLLAQWRDELTRRFFLGRHLGKTVHLVASDDIREISSAKPRMLVIDEAHHIVPRNLETQDGGLFWKIKDIADEVERLLLLTGTPALHRPDAFLAILHLLDPATHPIDAQGIEVFQERVHNRQGIANAYNALVEDNDPILLEGPLNDLRNLLPDDEYLGRLIDETNAYMGSDAYAHDEERARCIRGIRAHVNETCRLHRRMLRTRRGERANKVIGRNGHLRYEYEDPAAELIDEIIDRWRLAMLDKEYPDPYRELVFRVLVEAASDRHVLRALADACLRGDKASVHTLRSFGLADEDAKRIIGLKLNRDESRALQQLRGVLSDTETDPRIEAAVRLVTDCLSRDFAVVVFISCSESADHLAEKLAERVAPSVTIVRAHESSIPAELAQASVVICDRSGEEGLNLQRPRAIVAHLDLPLSPNRIEQRIGRLDRYGTGRQVESAVLLPKYEGYLSRWCECLDEGYGVFERSISALQYIIDQWMEELRRELINRGSEAFRLSIESLGGPEGEGAVKQELSNVERQDELDAIDLRAGGADDRIKAFVQADRTADAEFSEAIDNWVTKGLRFRRFNNDLAAQYVYHIRQGEPVTIMPAEDLVRFAGSVFAWGNTNRNPSLQTAHYTYNRDTAIERGVEVLRPGNAFLDIMYWYARSTDIGISYFMWRHRPNLARIFPSGLFFRFDFVVETDVSAAFRLAEATKQVTRRSIRRKADALFPPSFYTIWLNDQLRRVTTPEVIAMLEEPYSKDVRNDGGTDINVSCERWQTFDADQKMDRQSWADRCLSARDTALAVLREAEDFIRPMDSAQQSARAQIEQAAIQARSRRAYLLRSQADVDETEDILIEEIDTAILDGIERPKIRIDSAGAVYLSRRNPF